MDESVKGIIPIYPVIVRGGRRAYGSKIPIIIIGIGPLMRGSWIGGYNPARFIGLYALFSCQTTCSTESKQYSISACYSIALLYLAIKNSLYFYKRAHRYVMAARGHSKKSLSL